MNDETLKYYIALQPFFEKAMGEWQEGDHYFNAEIGYEVVTIDIDGDIYWPPLRDAIRLPLPIDPRCPERGLWGMVRWGWKAGTISIFIEDRTGNMRIFGNTENDAKMINVTRGYVSPELALLRALCHQEGVTVT
jgi:hypothetical protein